MNPRLVLSPQTGQVFASVFTSNAPHWFVYLLIGLGVAAYLGVGLLRLSNRYKHRSRRAPGTNPQVRNQPAVIVEPTRQKELRS